MKVSKLLKYLEESKIRKVVKAIEGLPDSDLLGMKYVVLGEISKRGL